MRRLALLTLVALLLPASLPVEAHDGFDKAEPALQLAIAQGGAVTFVVQGPDLAPPTRAPQDRAAWRVHWDAASAPFLGELRQRVAQLGGEVVGETRPVDAAHVRMQGQLVPQLLAWSGIVRAGLDTPDSTHPTVSLGEAGALEQVPTVQGLGYDGTGVTVAMIDTGVRPLHEMIVKADGTTRIAQWHDATVAPGGAGYCATPCDANGHGTHTATTAIGSHNTNANAPLGMAPGATLYVERIFQGGGGTWQAGQEGLQKAFDVGADITSNSWGGGCDTDGTITAQLVTALSNAGMVNVIAAGNNGPGANTVQCPGIVPEAITVGAVDINGGVAGFSSRGPCTWQGVTRACPDVVAMGVNLVAGWNSCDTCYISEQGTSMATPQVAGIVALLEQASVAEHGRKLTVPEAELLVRYSAKDLGAPGPDNTYGWGLAQAKAALDLLRSEGPGVVPTLVSTPGTLHGRDTGTILFAAANLGASTVTGTLTHVAEQLDTGRCPPACERVTMSDGAVSLAPGGEAQSTYQFVAADHAAGSWRVTARFDYAWTDGQGTHSGSVERTASFLVKKVDFRVTRSVPEVAHPGDLVLGGVTITNHGNENASSVSLHEVFDAAGFVPVPASTGALPYGAFADPAPNAVKLSPPSVAGGPFSSIRIIDPTADYAWSIGSVPAGQGWSARYEVLAGQPGSYAFTATLAYTDETGSGYFLQVDEAHAVALPV